MVKHEFNLVLGIICMICLIINITLKRDPVTVCVSGLATILNLIIAFGG